MKTFKTCLTKNKNLLLNKNLNLNVYNFCEIVNSDTLMKYIKYDSVNQQFSVENKKVPEFKSNSCLIKVKSFGINRADLLFKSGKYVKTKEMSDIMGLEFAGYLVEDSGKINYNKKYMSIIPGGGYAE
jgi:NADPH:quinone reductase-like Zn-dependent oxidoreductase